MQNLQLFDPLGGQGDFDIVTAINAEQQQAARKIEQLEKENLRLQAENLWYQQAYERENAEARWLRETLDRAQAFLFSVKSNSPAKVVKDIFQQVRDEVETCLHSLGQVDGHPTRNAA